VKLEDFDWKNTRLLIPAEFPNEWTEIFTETKITTKNAEGEKAFYLEELLNRFPVALLLSGGQE
jgi:maltooligosyltrehalose synthase